MLQFWIKWLRSASAMSRVDQRGRSAAEMRAFSAIFIGFVLISGVCSAHSDRSITVKADGSLEGLPAEYGPAYLHVEFAIQETSGVPIASSITLNLGKNRVSFPGCLTGLLQIRSMSQIVATASWYHDEGLLPYYLKFYFVDPGYDESRWPPNQGYYSLLFNLRTGKLMEIEVNIVRDSGRSMQSVPVDLAQLCKGEALKGFSNAPSP